MEIIALFRPVAGFAVTGGVATETPGRETSIGRADKMPCAAHVPQANGVRPRQRAGPPTDFVRGLRLRRSHALPVVLHVSPKCAGQVLAAANGMSSLAAPAPANISPSRRWRLAAGVAVLVDVPACVVLHVSGVSLEFAQAGAFALAMLVAAVLLRGALGRDRLATSLFVVAIAYPLRAGVLSLLAAQFSLPLAIVPAALAGGLALLLGGSMLAGDRQPDFTVAVPLAIIYLLLLRLVYLGQIELAPQEAYYWNYAQHLDIGYLDHPPLVAWLIAATLAFGDGEFFVRLPAVLAWTVMLVFAVAFVRDLAGRGAALRSALLLATLPFFFGIGVMITPDAPLAAAWAAALFFLQRALLGGRRAAWLGAGVAIGIGMLAKYSMVLLPAAAFVFMLVDAGSRRALLSPWAWGGVLIALLTFSPVIAWNLQHDWASFSFQGSRRLAADAPQFSLHVFLAYALVLLTPPGAQIGRAHV